MAFLDRYAGVGSSTPARIQRKFLCIHELSQCDVPNSGSKMNALVPGAPVCTRTFPPGTLECRRPGSPPSAARRFDSVGSRFARLLATQFVRSLSSRAPNCRDLTAVKERVLPEG